MTDRFQIFISAGEASGDQIGSMFMKNLEQKLASKSASVKWSGMGGNKMGNSLFEMKRAQSAGLAELIPNLPRVINSFITLKNIARDSKPDLAVLIDFPDFNLRLAKYLTKLEIPILYYVAPQCWVWRESRVRQLGKYVNKLAVIFPFEQEWFRSRGVDTDYVGHPLVHLQPLVHLGDKQNKNNKSSENNTAKITIGIFPGSRRHEIIHILPVQLEAVKMLNKYFADDIDFRIVVNQDSVDLACKIQNDKKTLLNYGSLDDNFTLAWSAAGTVTFELAMRSIPWILTHRVKNSSYFAAKRFIKAKYFGMPNILLDTLASPELIQHNLQAETLTRTTIRLLADPDLLNQIKKHWTQLKNQIISAKVNTSVEQIALDMLKI